MAAGIGVGSAVFIIISAVLAVVFVKKFNDKKKKNKAAARAEVDANPVYGLYECDADPQVDKPTNVNIEIEKNTTIIIQTQKEYVNMEIRKKYSSIMFNYSKDVPINPQAEVQDTNDYYDCLYDEGTSGTRDNNSTYGDA